jgi:hypothetical protein
MLPALLDQTNVSAFIWGDSVYSDFFFDEFLKAPRFQSRIHEKGTRNCPLSDEAMVRNTLRSKIHARAEYVFAQMETIVKG